MLAWRKLRQHRCHCLPAVVKLQRRIRTVLARRWLSSTFTARTLESATNDLNLEMNVALSARPPEYHAEMTATKELTVALENAEAASPTMMSHGILLTDLYPLAGLRSLLDQMLELASVDTSASCRHAVQLGSGLTAFDDI